MQRLGGEGLRQRASQLIALALGVGEDYRAPHGRVAAHQIWRHSIVLAVVAGQHQMLHAVGCLHTHRQKAGLVVSRGGWYGLGAIARVINAAGR